MFTFNFTFTLTHFYTTKETDVREMFDATVQRKSYYNAKSTKIKQ